MYEDEGLDIYGLEPDVESGVKLAVFTFRAFDRICDGEWKIKAYGPSINHKFQAWVTPKGETKPRGRLITDSPENARVEITAWLNELGPQNDV
jgi:hypothetical protein